MTKTLTAAIQFGSSRISAAAAWIDDDGNCEVAAIESTPTDGCIRHGYVMAVDDTAVRIKSLLQKLSNRLKAQGSGQITAAYVGICGMSMRSMEHHPSLVADESGEVTQEMIEALREQSMQLTVPGYEILGISSCGHFIQDQQLTAHHQLIIAESRLCQGYRAAMEKAKIRIAGIIATPLMVGDILTNEEKQNGCLLVNLGAQLTTVSVYAQGSLRKLTVLPLGGDSVTADIASNGLSRFDAENIKQNWSDASRMAVTESTASTAIMACPIPIKELNVITASRYEEIAINIMAQVEKSGYKGMLNAGCVLTGGASLQKGLTSLLSKRLDMSHISTRSCNTIRYGSSERKPHLSSLMSMLKVCTESCEQSAQPAADQHAEQKPAPTPKPKTEPKRPEKKADSSGITFSRRTAAAGIRGFFDDLFSGIDEN
ncbi:MAG: hypothetical protein KBT20_01905 [Bacteroidales bacterium]|nr:hypothetical protein [Candidatus Liminaster caballi]